jgi:hypothetical protein
MQMVLAAVAEAFRVEILPRDVYLNASTPCSKYLISSI